MIDLRQIAKLFLRLTVAASMLSAVADRFGIWSKDVCMWGNMNKFVAYTQSLIPYIPANAIPVLAWIATILEILLSICLLIGLKLKVVCIAHRTNDSYLCYCYGNVYGL